jgi:hypothetical protein
MIYCASGSGSGSGSYFVNILVLVPAAVPVPVSVPDPDPDLFSPVFHQHKICTKFYIFNARSSNVSQKVGL